MSNQFSRTKRITLSADDELIDQARSAARRRGTTLNDEIRRWLADYAAGRGHVEPIDEAKDKT